MVIEKRKVVKIVDTIKYLKKTHKKRKKVLKNFEKISNDFEKLYFVYEQGGIERIDDRLPTQMHRLEKRGVKKKVPSENRFDFIAEYSKYYDSDKILI